MSFKYWQTAFEIDFLFRIPTEERIKKHNKIYWAINLTVFVVLIAPVTF